MKSISALAIVSIIAILLAIGLVYIVIKPPKITTTTSYIPTTEIITETSISATTYVFTTTYVYTTTYTTLSTYPTTITQTITETLTYTYVPTEKIEVAHAKFEGSVWWPEKRTLALTFRILNKEYSSIYIDPNRPIIVKGKGLLINHPNPKYSSWSVGDKIQREPFIFSGSPYSSPYNPAEGASFCGFFTLHKDFPEDPDFYDPNEIEIGGNYTVSFDYKVIYINGTMSDWKTYTFNITLQKGDW
jgi:hypothetical protein